MAPVQHYDYPHNKAGDLFDVDNNQNNMFINNYNSSMQNHAMQEPDFSSCSGGAPMGMQPLRHFDEQNSCNMQMNPSQNIYGSMQRNKGYKNEMDNMNFCDNQFGPQQGQIHYPYCLVASFVAVDHHSCASAETNVVD
jgi:hypothetical protein